MVSDLIVLVLYIDSSATQNVYTTCSEHTHLSLANEKVDSLGQNCEHKVQHRESNEVRGVRYTFDRLAVDKWSNFL